jgi:hypothetical protein
MVLAFTQPLTEVSTRNHLGVKHGRSLRLSMSRLFRQCGAFAISQPYRPAQPVTGIVLHYGGVCFLLGTNWTVSTATSSQYLAVNCEPIA